MNRNIIEKSMGRSIQLISIFMIFLVVTLPISSVQAFAFTTYGVSSKNVRGYRAETDTTAIIAEISESGVKASDVKLITNKNTPFSQCSFSLGTSICRYDFASGKWAEGEWTYQVSYDGQSAQSSIIVDKIAPVVEIKSIVQQGKLMIDYSVAESAFKDCSGINRVEFTLGGTLINTTKLNFTPGTNCDYSKSVGIEAPSTNNKEKDLCLNVFDNVGNKGTSCQKVLVDKELGEIIDLQIVDSSGSPISYVASAVATPIGAMLKFKIKEYNLDKVTADASEFAVQDTYRNNQKIIDADCYVTSNDEYSCEVPIVLDLPNGGNPLLKIHIKDKAGNEDDKQKNILIKIDSKNPVVKSFASGVCGKRNVIGDANNTITVTIEEADSGLNGKKVYLDLSSVVEGSRDRVFPNECKKAGINWICRWGPFDKTKILNHGAALGIKFVSPSQDDSGNPLQLGTDYSVNYYGNSPLMINYKITADSAEVFRNEIRDYPTVGGTLALVINVSSDLPVSASADFSQISSAVGKYNVQCTGDAVQTCLFKEVGPLKGPFAAGQISIPVTLKDCAGNKIEVQIPVEISQIESRTNDYCVYSYNHDTMPMPKRIDRITLKTLPQKTYFETAAYCSGNIISQKIINCDGNTGYLAPNPLTGQNIPELLGSPASSFYTKFNIRRAVSPPDSVAYTCKFMTIVKIGSFISQPEYDDVPFTLGFYNSNLGAADDALQKKIDDLKNSTLVSGQWIGTVTKWLNRANSACSLYNSLQTSAGILNGAAAVLSGASEIWAILKPAAAYVEAAGKSYSKAITIPALKEVCMWLSCEITPWSLLKNIPGLKDVYKMGSKASQVYTVQGNTWGADVAKALDFEFDPKKSIIVSTVSLCIPGVLYNLEKARNIECSYIYCIQTQVPNGIPPFFCESQRYAQWCKYVWGEAFQVIPFAQFIDFTIDKFKEYLSNPLTFLVSVALPLCDANTKGYLRATCRAALGVSEAISAVRSITAYDNNWKGILNQPSTICELVLKENK